MLYHPTELVKSQDVIVRVGSINGTARPVITQSGATFTVSGAPTLYTLQAATTASVAFNDGNEEFYLLAQPPHLLLLDNIKPLLALKLQQILGMS